MMTADPSRRAASAFTVLLFVAVSLGRATYTSADCRIFALSNGSSAAMLGPGDSFDMEIWLVSDNEETCNSVVLQLVFSVSDLMFDSYEWHGVFQSSLFDDSTPPGALGKDILSGPGRPEGIVDIELSNAVVGSFCVDMEDDSNGACDCPEGRCIGGMCVGGPRERESCSLRCAADEQCESMFDSGKLATLTFTVPADYAGPQHITIDVVPDAIANGFDELDTIPCAFFHVYLDCVAPGDIDCDGPVTLSDYGEWPGCMTGPGGEAPPPCAAFDFDGDGDVDLVDWRVFDVLFDRPCRPPCVAPGDIDCDGQVTLNDYGEWAVCMTGPGHDASSSCAGLDFDRDGDVDLIDWRGFHVLLKSPSSTP